MLLSLKPAFYVFLLFLLYFLLVLVSFIIYFEDIMFIYMCHYTLCVSRIR